MNVGSDLVGSYKNFRIAALSYLTLIVIILPLFMLWPLQLRMKQKIVLGGIFSLALVITVFDILRTVESLRSGTFSGVALWSSMEVCVAVIVGALPLFRVLLTRKGRHQLSSWSHNSLSRYKDLGDSQTGVERNGSIATSSPPGKPSVRTFRDDLETQELGTLKQQNGEEQPFPMAHIAH